MDLPALFGDRAELYDLIYRWKDYASESLRLRELLRQEGIADGSKVLEAACGTGNYLVHLAHWYEVSGFDESPEMLAIARRKLPRVPLVDGDLASFSIETPVDAALCLFSSIGYLEGEDRLREAARCFHAALRPGGLLVIEPWFTADAYKVGSVHMNTYDGPAKLCRMTVSRREGDVSIMTFHWLVGRPGESVETFIEEHRLFLFSVEQIQSALRDAGFEGRFEPAGLMPQRGLHIGRRRAAHAGEKAD